MDEFAWKSFLFITRVRAHERFNFGEETMDWVNNIGHTLILLSRKTIINPVILLEFVFIFSSENNSG